MTEPLHSFNEYYAAMETMCKLNEKKQLIGLSENDEKEFKEINERINNYTLQNDILKHKI